MKPTSKKIMVLLALIAIVLFWWTIAPDDGAREPNGSPNAASTPVGSTSVEETGTAAEIELTATNTANTTTVAPAVRPAVPPVPFFPIRDDPGAEAHIKALEPLERILTPISLEDQQWMEKYQYPKLSDIQSADLRELERQYETVAPDGRPIGQNRRAYIANVLTAAKYRAGDPTWRDWAQRTTSPFAHALLTADAAERFRRNPGDQDALRDLNYWWPRAFATGERAYAIQLAGQASQSPSFYQGYHRISPAGIMLGYAEIEKRNAYLQSRGLPPMTFEPRPAAIWTLWGSTMNARPGAGPGG
jgi:hypothetical protein